MFLHRVKRNWKKHQALTLTIVSVALGRMAIDKVSGVATLSGYGILGIALGVVLAAVAVAFLKTCWELGTVYYRKLCTFVVALRRFCRDFWSKTAAM
jgi:hypothetical protein